MPETQTTPSPRPGAKRPRRQVSARGLAWASVLCGLVYPVTVGVVLIGVLTRPGSGGNPVLAAFATVYLYFEWPFVVLALSFGRGARVRANPGRRLALVGLALGYLSAAVILGAALAVFVAARG